MANTDVNTTSPVEVVAENLLQRIAANLDLVLHGKHQQIELALNAIVSGGHLLIDDVPGVGKTLLAKALALTLGTDWRRVQFTADLLPTDVVASRCTTRKLVDSSSPGPGVQPHSSV